MSFHRAFPLLLGLLIVACSSGGDNGQNPTNTAPTIAFTFAKIAVGRGTEADLTVAVADEDGDKLTIDWTITRGALAAQNTSKTIMRWTAPVTVGTDTVRVQVSDGSQTRSVTATVKVGWETTGAGALSLYEKAKSPYIVVLPAADPTLNVAALSQTTIEPGVEILIDTPLSTVSVLGRLEAHGTEDEPIVFRPNDRTFQCGDERGWWIGILGATDDALNSDGEIDLEHVQIWYGQSGVRLREGATATIRDSQIRCSGDAGVLIEGNGSLVLLGSDITNGRVDGVAIAAIASLPDSVHIEGCRLAINGNAGLRCDLKDYAQAVPIVVEYNKIEFNATHGISLANAVFPRIHYNHFAGNGESVVSNIYLQGGFPDPAVVPELDATCNFWGAPVGSQATIDVTIRDSLDAASVHTRVITSPWINASPLTTPPNCP